MSNEELVAAIQAGEDRMGELWEQIAGLVKWRANHIMTSLKLRGNPCGIEFDDLYQSGYPALVDAVKTYDAEAGGAFSTWFVYYLKSAFAKAVGYRTERERNEPLNNALSLDTPLTDDSDSDTMMDVVADPEGQKPTQSVEEVIFQRQLREALNSALDSIPEQYSAVLRLRYYEGQTLAEIAEAQGTTPEWVRQKECKALRQLRQPKNAARLRQFYDFDFYCGAGMGAFQHTGMSIQERYLVAEEEAQERENRRRQERGRREQEQQISIEIEEMMARVKKDAESRVSIMTPEEKRAFLEKYGYA